MKAYVINLDGANQRWNYCTRALEEAGMVYERVPAVDGLALAFPHPDFDERGYRLKQGRRRIDAEVGCYLSHIKALRRFLESGEEYGLILEDDTRVPPELPGLLEAAVRHGRLWDMLRLSRVNTGRPVPLIRLDDRHHLGLMFTQEKGAGAYAVNRRAARIMVERFLPMQLPYDIVFDHEWLYGFRTMAVSPFPVSQKKFPTQIQYHIRDRYYPAWQRYWTVLPLRAAWETGRVFTRLFRLAGVLLYRVRMDR